MTRMAWPEALLWRDRRRRIEMKEPLLIVGASGRAAAVSAHRIGLRVIAADLFADQDLQAVAEARRIPAADYPHRTLNVLADVASTSWMYTGGLENFASVVAAISRRHRLYGNGPENLRRVRDPESAVRVWEEAGINAPRVAIGSTRPDANVSWLCKPIRSCGGEGICEAGQESAASVNQSDVYYQEFIRGRSVAGVYVADGREARLLGVTRQWLASDLVPAIRPQRMSPFAYVGSWGPLCLGNAQRDAWRRLGTIAATSFELRGLFGIDAIQTAEHAIVPVEINPRFTASVEIMERSCGVRAVELHLRACRGELPGSEVLVPDGKWGKAILYATQDCQAGPDFLRAIAERNTFDAEYPLVADIPALGTTFQTGQPIVTVLSQADDEPLGRERLGLCGRTGLLGALASDLVF